MTAEEDRVKDEKPAPSKDSVTRRNLLKAGVTVALVFVAGGVASVAKSLFSPANPPAPEAVPTVVPTVTKTSTVTSTVTVGTGEGGNQTAIASSTAASGSTSTSTVASTSSSPFPQVFIANISSLTTSTPIEFNYPLEETPNVLVKLGVKASGGVGPEGDIVAFSQVCQHLGCIWGFVAADASPGCAPGTTNPNPMAYCCCHGSEYDLTEGAKVIGGPAPRAVPQVTLMIDPSGDIYAVGMGPPTVFGHDTGSNNVLDDLQGGTLVSGT